MSDELFVCLFILRISKKFRKNKNDESERAATFEEFLKYFVDKDTVSYCDSMCHTFRKHVITF